MIFKITLPDVAFQLRAGYIFIILFAMFVIITLIDKKFESCELPSEEDRKSMLKWARILGGAGLFFIVAAAIVTIFNPIPYLNDIGFQAFYFFGVLVGSSAVWLWSNANDKKKDAKALPIDLKLFHTSKGYAYGALGICVITCIIYVLLW